jgi:hypothetical protein
VRRGAAFDDRIVAAPALPLPPASADIAPEPAATQPGAEA